MKNPEKNEKEIKNIQKVRKYAEIKEIGNYFSAIEAIISIRSFGQGPGNNSNLIKFSLAICSKLVYF